MEPFAVKAAAEPRRRRLYLVVKVSDEFQMVLSALQEHHAVSLLGHEKAQRQCQLVVQQHVLQPLGRLLGVSDLAEVASLCGRVTVASVCRAPGATGHVFTHFAKHNNATSPRTSALSCSPPVMASSCSDVISSVISMPAIFCTTSFKINRSKLAEQEETPT